MFQVGGYLIINYIVNPNSPYLYIIPLTHCTNILDTFASKTAAIQDETADASVGNVTGSNAVNVFLGVGIAWSMAAIYHEAQGNEFIVPVGRYQLGSS